MKVGDMVSWHDSEAKRFRNGIIVETRNTGSSLAEMQNNLYFVLWGHGKVFPHKGWELRSISESR